MRIVKKGATSQSVYLSISDSTSSTGGKKTGLVFNTASLTAYYVRNGGSAVAITLATLAAANSVWSSGGFKEVDATNMPGIYRLDVPDAAFASGSDSVVITLKGATGMVQVDDEVQLVAVDLQDATAFGLTNLDATVSSRLAAVGYTAPLSAAGVRSAVGLASANLDTQLSGVAAAVFGYTIEGTTTYEQSVRGQNAVLLGKASGLATTTATYRDLADTKARVTATVDADGNRTAVARDLT